MTFLDVFGSEIDFFVALEEHNILALAFIRIPIPFRLSSKSNTFAIRTFDAGRLIDTLESVRTYTVICILSAERYPRP
jgi:hypothetical protein